MKSNYVIYILICTIYFSCADNTRQNETARTPENTFTSAVYKTINIIEKDEDCETEDFCTRISIELPQITKCAKSLDNEKINRDIRQLVASGALEAKDSQKNLEAICIDFIRDYKSFESKVSDGVVPWELEIVARIITNDQRFISVIVEEESYLGGAHGNHQVKFLNYDVLSGKPLKLDEIPVDIEQFKKLAEQIFRENKRIAPQADLQQEGYTFDGNQFSLPENFGIENNHIILYYNNYEIAPYSMGPTELRIPLQSII